MTEESPPERRTGSPWSSTTGRRLRAGSGKGSHQLRPVVADTPVWSPVRHGAETKPKATGGSASTRPPVAPAFIRSLRYRFEHRDMDWCRRLPEAVCSMHLADAVRIASAGLPAALRMFLDGERCTAPAVEPAPAPTLDARRRVTLMGPVRPPLDPASLAVGLIYDAGKSLPRPNPRTRPYALTCARPGAFARDAVPVERGRLSVAPGADAWTGHRAADPADMKRPMLDEPWPVSAQPATRVGGTRLAP